MPLTSDLTVPSQKVEVPPPPRASHFLAIAQNSSVPPTSVSFFFFFLLLPPASIHSKRPSVRGRSSAQAASASFL